ncbi:putative PEP-binding protein, partial [Pseudomonas sp. NPDC089422]|uniref:putative PEP-binding protein n=1 Tax=Pseudomonas sp. NPDC089422 TaxID=3364466 RepID=UPI003806951C
NAIQACNKAGKYIGICGQGPSDHPDLAKWLMEQGIDSVSLNPDSVIETWLFLAEDEETKTMEPSTLEALAAFAQR